MLLSLGSLLSKAGLTVFFSPCSLTASCVHYCYTYYSAVVTDLLISFHKHTVGYLREGTGSFAYLFSYLVLGTK